MGVLDLVAMLKEAHPTAEQQAAAGPPLRTVETRRIVSWHYGIVRDGMRHYPWATPAVFEYGED